MSILSAQTLAKTKLLRTDFIVPWYGSKQIAHGMSYGLGPCGYDIRLRGAVNVPPGEFVLGTTVERFSIPNNVLMTILDKSTWARRGVAVQNSCAEPGWEGFLTLELSNHSRAMIHIPDGAPIAQAIFHFLDEPTTMPYQGKYQDQAQVPIPAIQEQP
jgi:dCTP deaminase